MVHDWDEMTNYETKRVEMLNDLAYAVFAVNLCGKGISLQNLQIKKQ
jgi:hypothetical protein